MSITMMFDKYAAISSGLQFDQKKHIAQVPNRDFWVETEEGMSEGLHVLVVTAHESGEIYAPLLCWLKQHKIAFGRF